MEEKKWEDYIKEVLSFVKFKYDHKAIRRELTEHMEDMREVCSKNMSPNRKVLRSGTWNWTENIRYMTIR